MTNKIFKTIMLGALAGSLIFTAKTELTLADTKADTKADIKAGAKADSIVLSQSKAKLQVGDEITVGTGKSDDITVTVTTSSKNKGFKISTKDSNKVKIKKSGKVYKVKALKSGKVNLKLTLSANKKVSKTLKLNIAKKDVGAFGKIITVTGENFDKEVLQEKGIVIVDFSAKWCGYCKLLEPLYKEAARLRPTYKFTQVDVDNDEELTISQGVTGYPRLHIYKDGKLVRIGGYSMNMTTSDLIDWIEN